jgi:hypothetical protein
MHGGRHVVTVPFSTLLFSPFRPSTEARRTLRPLSLPFMSHCASNVVALRLRLPNLTGGPERHAQQGTDGLPR